MAFGQRHAQRRAAITIGFGNLIGPAADPLVKADSDVLIPLFARSNVAEPGQLPKTPIVFLYASLTSQGHIQGTNAGVQKLANLLGAQLLVLAAENLDAAILASGKLREPAHANVIFTNNRNGDGFTRFFREVFESMLGGKTLVEAYTTVAPQTPKPESWLPGTIAALMKQPIKFPDS